MEKTFQKKNAPVRPKHSGELGDGVLTHESSVSPFPSGIQVQAQLETTAPGDALEREADSTADLVIQKIQTGSSGAVQSPSLSVRPSISASGGSSVSIPSHMESRLHSSQGSGHALPGQLRSRMEGAFGQGFSNVRIHSDSSAAELSRSVGAKAFTYGNDIYFNAGQYHPETAEGMHLLAHELTHTVQQGGKVAREPDPQAEPETADSELFALNFVSAIETVKDVTSWLKDFKEVKEFQDALDKCEKNLVTTIKKYNISKKPSKAKIPGASVLSWIAYGWGLISLANEAVRAYRTYKPLTIYYVARFLTTAAMPPPPAVFVQVPTVALLLSTFNTASSAGDLLYQYPLEWVGYNKMKEGMMHFTADRYGGADTTTGRISAGITSVPGVGEGYTANMWVSDRMREMGSAVIEGISDIGNSFENMLYDGYKSFMNGLMPF